MVFLLILQSIIPCGIKNLDFAGLIPDDLDKKQNKTYSEWDVSNSEVGFGSIFETPLWRFSTAKIFGR